MNAGIGDQITYGLEKIDEDRTIEVNLRDLAYVNQTLSELVRFFHQNAHWKDLSDVERFIGDANSDGAFHHMSECVYVKLRRMFPDDIDSAFGDGQFSNPLPPYYYQERDANT